MSAGPPTYGQVAPDDLAGGVAGKGVDEHHLAGHLVAGQPVPHVGPQLLGADVVAGTKDDEGLEALAELVVGHPDHDAFENGRVVGEEVLDLPRENVFTARDDHVVVPPVDEQPAGVVEMAGVPGRHQPVEDGLVDLSV